MSVSAGTATNQAPGLILADALPGAGATPVALTRSGLAQAPAASSTGALVQLGPGPFDGTAGAFAGLSAGTVLGGNMLAGASADWVRLQLGGADAFRIEAAGRTTAQGVRLGDVGLGAATPGLGCASGTPDGTRYALAQKTDATATYLNCAANGVLHFCAGGADKMVLNSQLGTLGLGSTGTLPQDTVHIAAGLPGLRIYDTSGGATTYAPLVLRAQQGTAMLSLNQQYYQGTAGSSGLTLVSTAPAPYVYLWTANADSFVSIGTSQSNNVAAAERVRIDGTGKVGIGTNAPKALLHGTGSTILGAASAAVSDGNIGASQVNLYLDESGNALKVRVRYSDGTTLRTATIALA